MKIIKGKIARAQKVLIYGPEGIGKSTFASHFPDVIFIDTEDSTVHMNVARFERPASWEMLKAQVRHVINNPDMCKTLAIDTLDWAEKLCMEHLIAVNKWDSIETPGYGKGFTVLGEEWGRFLNLLSDLIDRGINVICTAHAMMRKFEQPDELGAYDRWELKLQKKTAPLTKEWADMILFANYRTIVITDPKTKSKKGQGGQRVMYTTHHPAWDAKNRIEGMPEELPFEFAQIGFLFEQTDIPDPVVEPVSSSVPANTKSIQTPEQMPEDLSDSTHEPTREKTEQNPYADLPAALVQLMQKDNVIPSEIELICGPTAEGGKGYFPKNMPLSDYPSDFIDFLISSWSQFVNDIRELSIPFEIK